ncbi:MAG: hypothetical protein H7328_12425 [Bdellovibrio sp.]|nr:hypothetical protein [Bdellovibrio sp.]
MICPNCQTDVKITEQNYGSLYTCVACQAAYFINFDGHPEFGNMNVPEESMNDSTAPTAPDLNLNDYGESNVEPIVEFNQNEFAVVEPIQDNIDAPELSSLGNSGLQENLFETLQNIPLDQPEHVQAFGSFSDAAKDISDFGNSETQVASLNYDLKISGLDTVEILTLFKESIDDSRFGWETNELMRSIKNGEIYLEKLNPVKAYILSKRLQFLDVEKKWKQNVLS